MSIEFADPTMLALPVDLGGAIRGTMPEMLADGAFAIAGMEGGGSPGFLPLDLLRAQSGSDGLPAFSSAGREFASDSWFEVPVSLAALSSGGSASAYATGAGPAASGRLPGDEPVGPGAAADGDGGGSSETEQNDCRDRSALDVAKEVRNESDRDVNEHGSVVFRDANGQVQRSPLFQGDAGQIPLAQIFAWMAGNGVSMSQVIGLVHNHPAWLYGKTLDAMAVNRYPSGGVVNGGDWNAADYMVSRGAGGPDGAGFALYVIDTVGNLREFAYSDRDIYKNLTKEERERENGTALPDEMKDDGSSCG